MRRWKRAITRAALSLFLLLLALPPRGEAQDVDTYRTRREKLRGALGEGVAIFRGAREEDLAEYRQDSNFFFLTGVEDPGAYLLLLPKGERAKEVLFLPARDEARERWVGKRLGPDEEGKKATGFETILESEHFVEALPRYLDHDGLLWVTYDPVGIDEPLPPALDFLRRLRERHPTLTVKDAGPPLAELRKVKGPEEIALLRKAIGITMDGHREAMRALRPGMYEYEVEALIEYTFRRSGARGPGFPSIVGSGPYSTVLHYDKNERRIETGDLVVIDIGAEYNHYTADVTRTLPSSGQFSPEQREIYGIVLRAQKAALEKVKPGVRIREDIHAAARKVIEEAGYGDYFIHGTSHFLGMDVHDVGDYSKPLGPGMVITVEPGIYIPDKALGVRIEDDVLVTEDGYELLTASLPREPEEIERAMAEGTAGGATAAPIR